MNEYMLLIRNQIDRLAALTPEENQAFLKKCETYIGKLTENGNLIGAQPMVRTGTIISGSGENWNSGPFNENKEVIVGYYHIRANDETEAIEIAKGNPEFEYTTTARIEVRPLKVLEEKTGFSYPNKG